MTNPRCAVVLWSSAPTGAAVARLRADMAAKLPPWADLLSADNGAYSDPESALAAGIKAGGDVLLLQADTALPLMALQRLRRAADAAPEASVVSALHPAWLTSRQWPLPEADSALWWCLPRQVFPCSAVNTSCSFWRSPAGNEDWQMRLARLSSSHQIAVCSHLLVGSDSDSDSGSHKRAATHSIAASKVDSNDQPAATLLDALSGQLWTMTHDARPTQLPLAGLDDKPVILHILHGWGGGTARWVTDTANAWRNVHHLFLLSFANPSSSAHGQELRLFAGSMQGPCLQQWTLPPPIVASAVAHSAYQTVLDAVIEQHSVSGLVVSSLIGHSVEALETPLPTLCMLHDYYPAWPDLGLSFERNDADYSVAQLPAALRRSPFRAVNAEHWQALQTRWTQALNQPQVVVAAPSGTVRQNLLRIVGDTLPEVHTIAHGLPSFAQQRQSSPAPAANGRWRLLIPGRISEQKGAGVLRSALPELTRLADVYLLGGGKYAEAFYGLNHVHIVLQYDNRDLPRLLDQIKPDLALLLSTVSETFNYTLSEMWALDVPVMATRVGALEERIEHGKTGLLIDPDSESLVTAVSQLTRETLHTLVANRKPLTTPTEAVAEYQRWFSPRSAGAMSYRVSTPGVAQLAGATDARQLMNALQETRQLADTVSEQQAEIEERAKWAASEAKRAQEKTEWAQALERSGRETAEALYTLQEEFEDRTAWALKLNEENTQQGKHLAEVSAQLVGVAQELEIVLATRSWKLTRPLRVAARLARRALDGLGFQQRRAATLSHRASNSLRVRGLKGTVERIGKELRRGEPEVGTQVLIELDPDAPFEPLKFPHHDAPVVSVVIPTYNHFQHTQACLKSLTTHQSDVTFEVIVVDDCSSDETRDRLAEHSGLTIVHNEQNQGFIDTCNAGAAEAQGEFLFFLNNDTVVADHCLDHLVATFQTHPKCGLAGAKLVYPDGRMQEAGGIVFNDGSGWNYGRFENPAAPEVNFVREVDYCSGAAILIRRDFFDSVGGFDQRYRPAYYEDTDLAFQVREKGLKVIYQPRAQVVHFEGVTSGTDTATGVKRYQVVNQEKFAERWESVLKNQPDPKAALDLNRRHRRPLSVLIIDACTPTPDQDSGSVRMVNLMTLLLDLGWHVRFMAENRSFDNQYTINLQQLGVEVLYHPFVKSAHSYLKSVGKGLQAVILSRHYIASNHIDSVRSFCPNAQLIFDTVDLHYLREQRLAELEGNATLAQAARKTRTRELDVARRCDLTLVVSKFEQAFLARDAADLKVKVLSNIHPVHGCRKPFAQRSGLLFIGGFQHPPNVDGITWFVREVLPLVRQQLPEITVTVIGSKINDAVRALDGDGVEVLGFVEDIEPHLDNARLSLAPLRYGAGVKGKINMAMSYGQPVVATGPAVEGMHVEPGKEVMVGDTPQQFADGVIRAYTDEALWQTLSQNGLKNVEQHFSFEAARQALKLILKNSV